MCTVYIYMFNPNDAGQGKKGPRNLQWLYAQKSIYCQKLENQAMPTLGY